MRECLNSQMSLFEQSGEGLNSKVDVGQPNAPLSGHHTAGQTQGRFGISGGKLAL